VIQHRTYSLNGIMLFFIQSPKETGDRFFTVTLSGSTSRHSREPMTSLLAFRTCVQVVLLVILVSTLYSASPVAEVMVVLHGLSGVKVRVVILALDDTPGVAVVRIRVFRMSIMS
jgi:hypothetical protein